MATEVKYLSDTLRMIRNCEISPQRAREEVRFLINLIDARTAAAKAKPPMIDVAEWADKWQKATDEYDGPMRGRRAVQIQFILDLIRAATAADKAEPEDCVAHRMRAMREAEQPAPTKDFVAHLRRRAEREPAVKAALESRDDEQPAPAPAKVCYSRFTDRARKVMQLANQEAQRFNHEYVGTEHVLLGIVKEGRGVATEIIKRHGIDPLKVRLEIEKLVQSGPAMVTMGKFPQTPRVKRDIELAANEATQLGANYVGDEHILLGLLHDSESVAGSVLASLGMTLDRARSMLRELTCEPEQPAPAPTGDVPEWCVDRIRGLVGIWDRDRDAFHPHVAIKAIRWLLDKAESELARRVAEATDHSACHDAICNCNRQRDPVGANGCSCKFRKDDANRQLAAAEHRIAQRDAEIERLKAQLAKWESEPVGKMITELRDEERESKNREIAKLRAELAESRELGRAACESLADCIAIKNKRTEERDKLKARLDELLNENAANVEENDRLKAELAEATKPVEDAKTLFATDANGTTFLAVYEVDFRRERAARLAAEQRLALTREAWRHRWVDGGSNGRLDFPRTDADIDAAIAAHEKSKEASDGAR